MTPLEARVALRELAEEAQRVITDKSLDAGRKKARMNTIEVKMKQCSDTIKLYEAAMPFADGGSSIYGEAQQSQAGHAYGGIGARVEYQRNNKRR